MALRSHGADPRDGAGGAIENNRSTAATDSPPPRSIRSIEPELLLQELRSGRQIVVLDIRPAAEFRGPSGRIAGAWSIPFHQLALRSAELLQHRYDRIVVVARTDMHERTAALSLELLGFGEVQTLRGGMEGWIRAGLPIAHGTMPPSR